jgi:hypothetical protein
MLTPAKRRAIRAQMDVLDVQRSRLNGALRNDNIDTILDAVEELEAAIEVIRDQVSA